MDSNEKILIAGANGLVGSAIDRQLRQQGYTNIVGVGRQRCDFRNQQETFELFRAEKPDYVFLAAAKVGGIGHNQKHPAEYIRDNLLIQTNVIDSAYVSGAKKLLFLGSACIYPKFAPVPIKETDLLTGPMEPTNIGYALSKIIGLTMCQKYTEQYGFKTVSVMPNNLYGIHDNFDPEKCHVIPSFINRFIAAKENNYQTITCFGDGTPTREFLYSDDLADACIFLMNNYDDPGPINIGPNHEVTIKELAETVADIFGYQGQIVWDTSKPNGTPRRALDTSKMDALGWKPKVDLRQGLRMTIDWYLNNRDTNEIRV
jgi:GDP-L-fucose synthase